MSTRSFLHVQSLTGSADPGVLSLAHVCKVSFGGVSSLEQQLRTGKRKPKAAHIQSGATHPATRPHRTLHRRRLQCKVWRGQPTPLLLHPPGGSQRNWSKSQLANRTHTEPTAQPESRILLADVRKPNFLSKTRNSLIFLV